MKKQVGVITQDFILFNRIRLLLRDVAAVLETDGGEATDRFSLLLADLRVCDDLPAGAVTLGDGGDLPLLFRHEDILALLDGSEEKPECLSLSERSQSAYIFGEEIRLTDVEYKLLDAILSADGFISKQEILHTVWGDGYDLGVVNVYVHYLRKKLEKNGTKVIISSRNEGYRIDEKYRRKS